jgi:hypothetical protein
MDVKEVPVPLVSDEQVFTYQFLLNASTVKDILEIL